MKVEGRRGGCGFWSMGRDKIEASGEGFGSGENGEKGTF